MQVLKFISLVVIKVLIYINCEAIILGVNIKQHSIKFVMIGTKLILSEIILDINGHELYLRLICKIQNSLQVKIVSYSVYYLKKLFNFKL